MSSSINFPKKPINPSADLLKVKTERNSVGTLKVIIILLLILVQLSALILSYLYFMGAVQWFWGISLVLSFLTCIYVMSSNKNSQSKSMWIIFLITCFSFGYIIYFISDDRIFWHSHRKAYKKILKNNKTYQQKQPLLPPYSNNTLEATYLNNAGNFSIYQNSKTTYFSNGNAFMDSVFEDIKKAKNFIFIEFFIVKDGIVLERLLHLLKEKIEQGVEVRFIYDDLGSLGALKRKTKKRIKRMGIKLVPFNKVLSKFSVFLNFRDHRKIIVIDGQIAYTGGVNLADEYTNESRIHGYWKDAGIKIEGPAVDGFSTIFLNQWDFVLKQAPSNYAPFLNHNTPIENTSLVIPYADGLEYPDNIGKNAYLNLISNAKEKIYIMSPYLVLDDTLKTALISKAKSGVDVRIIIPEIADKKLVYIVSRNTAEKLSQEGVHCYIMKNSFVHSKIMLTESSAIVGSINMDLRSFYQQFESAVYLSDPSTLNSIHSDFLNTFNKSTELTNENMNRRWLSFRIIAGFINLFSPFM